MTNHPHIVHFFGVTKLKEREIDPWPKVGLVLELFDISLYDLLHERKELLKESDKLNIALGIAYAIVYLHNLGYVHNVIAVIL
jgi:serine/threonine protein kinase